MTRVLNANYTASGTDYLIPGSDSDAVEREDLSKTQKALEEHTHVSTRGLQIPTGGIADEAVTNVKVAAAAGIAQSKISNAVRAIDADKVDGYDAGNASGNVPVSNGTVNTNLNADKLDGYDASGLAAAHDHARITTASGRYCQIDGAGNVALNADVTTTAGGGTRCLIISVAGTVPGSNPTNGGILYVNPADGGLYYRGAGGTVTLIAPT